jgi:hypothetical protein
MVQLRSQYCHEHAIGLTHLYNEMDDGGFRDLANCHLNLDRAVVAAYGWPVPIAQDSQELVRSLSIRNKSIIDGAPYQPFPNHATRIEGTFIIDEDPRG